MHKLSAVIITYNEEACIGRTLAALDFCDEIVVVDSGSTDTTVSICQQCKCTILTRSFDGYGTQKQFAVSKASYDWILAVDADEVVTDSLKQEIIKALTKETDVQGYFIPISLVFLGKLLRFGGEYKKPHLRLFNRQAGTFTKNTVHEGVHIEGKTQTLKNHILHYSYKNISDYILKFNAYTSAAAKALKESGRKTSPFSIVLRFPLTFFKIYFVKGCLFDGYQGFIWSLLSSLYPVVKYAKLLEQNSGNV